jgi:hypothetical protein
MKRALLALVAAVSLCAPACASTADEDASSSDDALVASFHRQGITDLTKTSRIMLVGDSDELGELPLYAATTRAQRYTQLYPQDQIILFVTKDASAALVSSTGSTVLHQEGLGAAAIADLSTLTAEKLLAALHHFKRIASLDFFGHSSPFGALLENGTPDHTLGPSTPANAADLADNFARDTNPYVTLNGCNGGTFTAPALSRLWHVPVSGALTASNFEILLSDGRWYPNEKAQYPDGLTPVAANNRSFGPASTPACSTGACVRMKPENAPYWGIWSPDTGFQYGLNYYKFFCDYDDPTNTCAKGMATSLFAYPSIKPIDKTSSAADVNDVIADFFCDGNKDATWFDTCKAGLLSAVASGAPFSPMKGGNDYSLECDFKGCEQKFRCTMLDGVPQQHSCQWVSKACTDAQPATSCRTKSATKQTTTREVKRYLQGIQLLRGG